MDKLATFVLLPGTRQEIQVRENAGAALLAALEMGSIDTPADEEVVASALQTAHHTMKELDDLRLEAGRPAREAQKEINDYFRVAIRVWSKAKARAVELLTRAAAKRAAERDAALALVATAVAAPQDGGVLVPYNDEWYKNPRTSGVAYRQELVIYITDRSQIPEEYWRREVDLPKIKAAWQRGEKVPGTTAEVETKARAGR